MYAIIDIVDVNELDETNIICLFWGKCEQKYFKRKEGKRKKEEKGVQQQN